MPLPPTERNSSSARAAVLPRLALCAREFPDITVRTAADVDGDHALDARDASLARAIEQTVLRRWSTLRAIVAPCIDRDWADVEPKLQGALLAGAAQLTLLERVPDHAAIDETVRWAKNAVRPGAGGFVNAVLRRVAAMRVAIEQPHELDRHAWHECLDLVPLEDGRVLRLDHPVFDEDDALRLAQQTSHGLSLVEHWISTTGFPNARAWCRHGLVLPPTIIHGLTPDAPAWASTEAHDEEGFRVWRGSHRDLAALLAADSAVRVQDAGSARPMQSVRALGTAPHVIVDYCAGRGTKTRQLAALLPDAEIHATDVDDDRRTSLRETFEGHARVKVFEPGDSRHLLGAADLLVLDVPCSNSGVLARRLEARYRFDHERLRGLRILQRSIVLDAINLLKPEGALLYATCSLEREENDRQIDWMRKRWELEALVREHAAPTGEPGEPPSSYRDGGFHALLRRA